MGIKVLVLSLLALSYARHGSDRRIRFRSKTGDQNLGKVSSRRLLHLVCQNEMRPDDAMYISRFAKCTYCAFEEITEMWRIFGMTWAHCWANFEEQINLGTVQGYHEFWSLMGEK